MCICNLELAASVEKAEPVEKLADSLAELTLSLAMRTLFEIKDHTELQQHDKTTDTPKVTIFYFFRVKCLSPIRSIKGFT